jgi:hypothetical protein
MKKAVARSLYWTVMDTLTAFVRERARWQGSYAVAGQMAGKSDYLWGVDTRSAAAAQNNLGIALSTLGQRESGTARLLEAVDAYRDALKELTRERVPLDWAMTQSNLGTAQALLDERLGPMHKSCRPCENPPSSNAGHTY